MIKASLFLWLVLLPLLLKAQSDTCLIKIKGKISDNHNSQPLSFAKIFIISNNAGYESDVNGNYLINNICKGILKIRLEHIECESQYIEINLMHDTIINFLLEHHAHLLKEIEVNESKSEVSSLYNRYQLNEWELMDSRGLTLSEGLKKVPGITALNTGSSISKPMIHGLQGNRILILNNGVRLEGQQWGNEHAPEIDAFSAGEITVVKGAMSVRYGSDALGGVLLIEPKTLPDSGKLSGNTFTTLQSNGLQASNATMLQGVFYSFGKLQYRINGTFKKAGNIHTPNYRLDNTGIEEKDFSTHLKYSYSKIKSEFFYSSFNNTIGIYSGTHVESVSEWQKVINGNTQPNNAPFTYAINGPHQKIKHQLIKGKLAYLLGHVGDIQLTYSLQKNHRNEFESKKESDPDVNLQLTTHAGELIFNHHADWGLVGQTGVFFMYQKNTCSGEFLIPDYLNKNLAGFIIEKYVRANYLLEAGVRYDVKTNQSFNYQNKLIKYPQLNYHNISYNLAGNFFTNNPFNLMVNLSTAWRSPGVNELYSNGVHHGSASYEVGNPTLQIEKSYTATVIEKYNHHFIQLLNESYINYFPSYITLTPSLNTVLTTHGIFPVFYYTKYKSYIAGNDLSISLPLPYFFKLNNKVSVIYAQSITTKLPLPLIPANRLLTELIFEKEFSAFYPIIALEHWQVFKQYRYTLQTDYLPPPPAYQLVNFKIGSKKLFTAKNIQLIFSVRNILNTRYRDYTNRFRYFTDEIGRNYVLQLNYFF